MPRELEVDSVQDVSHHEEQANDPGGEDSLLSGERVVFSHGGGNRMKHRPTRGILMVMVLMGWVLASLLVAGCATSTGAPVVEAKPKRKGVYHTVKRHQTLWRICKTYDVNMAHVAKVNGIKDVSKIRVGQKIFIPGAETVRHVEIYIEDLGSSGAKPVKIEPGKIRGRFVWPVRGAIIRRFDRSRQNRHDGIDIAAPLGTPVKSADSGKVIYSGNEIKGYGNIIIIKHGPIFSSVYAHNAENLVREGDLVKRGQMIARVGQTGRAHQAHLHFQIRNHSRPMDPLVVLP